MSLLPPNFAATNQKNMTSTKLRYPASGRLTAACPNIRTDGLPCGSSVYSVSSSLGLVMMKYLAAEHTLTRPARNRVPGCCDSTRSVYCTNQLIINL